MRIGTIFLVAALYAIPAHGQQMVECRDLAAGGGYLAANETVINGKACRAAGSPLQAVDSSHPAALVTVSATPPSSTATPVATPPAPLQAATEVQPTHQTQSCLIVRQAEGHRFRNSMIAGALTGGIGFAVGAASGGAKYEYVDSFKLSSTKLKYEGKELQKLQENGVHIITVSKKASADEIKDARESCKQ